MTADDALGYLRYWHPGMEIWRVPLAEGGAAWCARPRGSRVTPVHAYGPEDLDKDLRATDWEVRQGSG